jgi:hypothetical protein
VLQEYAVTFNPIHGFGSATVVYDLSQESRMDPRPMTVLYVGDYDPSGLCMSERDLPQRITRYQGNVTLERVALTVTDTMDATLPSFDIDTKNRDSRYTWFVENHGLRCWELDALNPAILRERVRRRIEAFIDPIVWERYAKVEAGERQSLIDVMNQWPSFIHGSVCV